MPNSRVIIGDSRDMREIEDVSIQLMVTSPPYWHIKDYGTKDQIGHGQSLHDYLRDLYRVWMEVFRVLEDGRRACINIGDQFLRASQYGRYKVVPLHAEVILQMERIGFDFMGSIIWNKRTSMSTSGGANIMGSYPYPPNGIVEIDYEHILIFRKPGAVKKFDRALKETSKLSKGEWKEYHLSHWNFGGARQIGHEAMFPEMLPKRLIRMYSLKGETVLDPFLGSGTTAEAARKLGREFIGYEINPDFIPIIRKKLVTVENWDVEIMERNTSPPEFEVDHIPTVVDIPSSGADTAKAPPTHRVNRISRDLLLDVEDIGPVGFAGIEITDPVKALEYLQRYVAGKQVILRDVSGDGSALVYMTNRIHINKELVKRGFATVQDNWEHPVKRSLLKV
ncbi:MAG: site-specific DNA-methyltransferase [Candidatus Thermoplasmatota archaeon]|nr:site-specific DNA-methyltransferase [Candidatus Thermoplasmatota archaeon]